MTCKKDGFLNEVMGFFYSESEVMGFGLLVLPDPAMGFLLWGF